MINLDWLTEMSQVLPDKSNYQKSFFDIAGFPRWENVNSNLLAFYFDKEEEHNFRTLFIESLLKLVTKDPDINFENNFDVLREVRTNNGKYIDIVIKSKNEDVVDDSVIEKKSEWAIIIENKVDTWLYNDLKDYWKYVKAEKKIAFVLSKTKLDLTKHNKNGIYYHSITHEELIEKVQENLFGYFSQSNEKHILLLKEYINNIENLYFNDMGKDFNAILSKLSEHSAEIEKLKKTETSLIEKLSTLTFEVFKEFGFKPTSEKKTSKAKHFYVEEKLKGTELAAFRFYVNFERSIYTKSFNATFELHKRSNTKYGTDLKNILKKDNTYSQYIFLGNKGSDKTQFNHIFLINIPLNFEDEADFSTEFKNSLRNNFFKKKLIQKAEAALIEVKKREKANKTVSSAS